MSNHLGAVAEVADVLQIGARNMQNFSLLEVVGRLRRPVLLSAASSATIQELFMAAEYIPSLGNYQVILCERGIRTFETMTRNTFDLSAVVMTKRHSHLPVIADPSHGVGISWAVRHWPVPRWSRGGWHHGGDTPGPVQGPSTGSNPSHWRPIAVSPRN